MLVDSDDGCKSTVKNLLDKNRITEKAMLENDIFNWSIFF